MACEGYLNPTQGQLHQRLNDLPSGPTSIFYMSVLSTCLSMHHMHAWCPQRLEEGAGFPGAGVTVVNHRVGAGN